ncbi:hypothetical protein ACLOJK_002056 [Asimina triloba]
MARARRQPARRRPSQPTIPTPLPFDPPHPSTSPSSRHPDPCSSPITLPAPFRHRLPRRDLPSPTDHELDGRQHDAVLPADIPTPKLHRPTAAPSPCDTARRTFQQPWPTDNNLPSSHPTASAVHQGNSPTDSPEIGH